MKNLLYFSLFMSFFLLYSCETEDVDAVVQDKESTLNVRGGDCSDDGPCPTRYQVQAVGVGNCCVTYYLMQCDHPDEEGSSIVKLDPSGEVIDLSTLRWEHNQDPDCYSEYTFYELEVCLEEGQTSGTICLNADPSGLDFSFYNLSPCNTVECSEESPYKGKCVYWLCWEDMYWLNFQSVTFTYPDGSIQSISLGNLYLDVDTYDKLAGMLEDGVPDNIDFNTQMKDIANCSKAGFGETVGMFFVVPAGVTVGCSVTDENGLSVDLPFSGPECF